MELAVTASRHNAPPKTTPADPPAVDAPEHVKARWWREHVAGLSRPELAKRTGFSLSSIQQFEEGINYPTGKPPGASAWERYRTACAAVSAELTGFDWLSLTVRGETVRFDEDEKEGA